MKKPIENQIAMFFHCLRCLEEKPEDVSPRDWTHNEMGTTPDGRIQVWCIRHEMNVGILGAPASMPPFKTCEHLH